MKPNWLAWALSVVITVFQSSAQNPDADRKTFEQAKAKAENGDAQAQCYLGVCYVHGDGVAQDSVEAAKWFRKSAEQGNVTAQFNLGLSYENGNGVTNDYVEAMKWYRAAAKQDDPKAENNLGSLYERGLGTPRDMAEAAKWTGRSAQQGLPESQYALGCYYANGLGVPKDYVAGYKWFDLALAQGYSPAGYVDAKEVLAELEQKMTRAQIAQAQRLAREFKPGKLTTPGSAFSESDIFDSSPASSGTGFFITENGFLITNEHVVHDTTQIRLVTSVGFIPAKIVKVDAANDLALLKVEGKFSPLPIASSRTMHLGNTVTTVGFPNIGLQGFAPKFARGEIAALSGAADDAKYFQISVPVQPGNSGGALVDEHGNVVGVVSAKLSALAALNSSGALPENVNYAVKSSFLLSFLESVPEVSAKLKEPETKDRKADDVVKSAEQAAVLVLVY